MNKYKIGDRVYLIVTDLGLIECTIVDIIERRHGFFSKEVFYRLDNDNGLAVSSRHLKPIIKVK